MDQLPENIALVYDRVNKWGGAESVLLALHELFPDAPLFTSVYEPRTAAWAKVFPDVIPTYLQRLPFIRTHHEIFPFLSPLAFESLNFQKYQLVISVTSADAKGIITQPGTFHLCYCLTPTRYLWSHAEEYRSQLKFPASLISRPVFKYLQDWDKTASTRPDAYISISQTVSDRIQKYYGRSSQIVYPPVDVDRFSSKINAIYNLPPTTNNYYLYVSRFVSYKRPEIVISAFNRLKKPLVVVGTGSINWGTGSLENALRRLAGPNITFTGFVSPEQLVYLFQHCRGLVFYHEEDFGIVAAEAQAAGKPVIGLHSGGVSEIVIDRKTGLLSSDPSLAGLVKTIQGFEKIHFDEKMITNNARRFSKANFNSRFINALTTEWTAYKNIYLS